MSKTTFRALGQAINIYALSHWHFLQLWPQCGIFGFLGPGRAITVKSGKSCQHAAWHPLKSRRRREGRVERHERGSVGVALRRPVAVGRRSDFGGGARRALQRRSRRRSRRARRCGHCRCPVADEKLQTQGILFRLTQYFTGSVNIIAGKGA